MERPQSALSAGGRRRPLAFECVAEQLRREIMLGLVAPGQALPTERDLMRLLGVGRPTVQKALASLKSEGFIERRRGRGGGSIVTLEIDSAPAEATRAALRPLRQAISEALRFRLDAEPIACGMAALFHEAGELGAICSAAATAREATDDPVFMHHDTEFHVAIARAAHNRFYADALNKARTVLDEAFPSLPDSALWHARSNREHEVIIAAISRRDEFGATRAMREHVQPTDTFVRALLDAL